MEDGADESCSVGGDYASGGDCVSRGDGIELLECAHMTDHLAPELADAQWMKLQEAVGGHFLQSVAWAEVGRAQNLGVVRAAGDGWSYQGFVTRGRGGVHYLYCPYGPTVKRAGLMKQVAVDWRERLDVDFVRAEPMGAVAAGELQQLGMMEVKEFQPKHTLVVDLTRPVEELRSDLASGHRNPINGTERRGLAVRLGEGAKDLDRFLEFMYATAVRTGFRPHSDDYFRMLVRVLEPAGALKQFVIEHEGRPVAAALSFDYAGTRAYAHAASDPEARKLNMMASLVWWMMMDAKDQGFKRFDLWGIAPEGAPKSHPWAGFTQFKRGFGGQEEAHVGTWELPLKPVKYRLYAAAKRLQGRG